MLNNFSVGPRSGELSIGSADHKSFTWGSNNEVSSNLDLLLDDSYESRIRKRDVAYYAKKVGEFLGILTFVGLLIAIPVLTVYGVRDKVRFGSASMEKVTKTLG